MLIMLQRYWNSEPIDILFFEGVRKRYFNNISLSFYLLNTIIDNKPSEHLYSSGPSLPGYSYLYIKIINSLQFFDLLGILRLLILEIIALFIEGCVHDSLATEDRIHAFHHVPILKGHGGRS
jgi:hypothetical protein